MLKCQPLTEFEAQYSRHTARATQHRPETFLTNAGISRIAVYAARAILGMMAALFLFSQAAAAAGPIYGSADRPRDPLFNLPYDPAEVHFDSIALSSVAQCAPILGSLGRGTGRAKLFGAITTGRVRVLIMGDQDARAPRGLSGMVLVMRGESCVTSIPLFALRRTFVNNPSLNPGLSASDVALLLKDTLARYAHAFGTKAAFLTWADRQTMQADIAYRATPSMPCPLLYTSLFTQPMLQVLSDFRAS